MEMITASTLHELVETAATVARRAGETVRRLREHGATIAKTKSSDVDVVTAADHESERMLTELLRNARPTDGVLGEEGASVAGTSGITWVLDPIDGTVNYLYGLPGYAVSVAATADVGRAYADTGIDVDGRRAVAGAVYVPATDECFTAVAGCGAKRNGETIRVRSAPALGTALVGTGFGYTVAARTEQAEVIRQLLPQLRDIRRLGAASTDLCLVASGKLDAFYERGLNAWDYAAGALIAQEAGAQILALNADETPGTGMLIAGAPPLASALQEALRAAYATLG